MQLTATVAKGYSRNLLASLAIQAFFFIATKGQPDGLPLRMCVLYSIPIYGVMATIIIARRPSSPTRGDLIAIRYGFLFILVGVACCFISLISLRSAMTGLSP